MTEPVVVHLGPGESIAQALIRTQLIATDSESIAIPPGVHIVNPDVTQTRITDPTTEAP